jgi:hypothetical protein
VHPRCGDDRKDRNHGRIDMVRILLFLWLALAPLAAAAEFDHSHRTWERLLREHVILIDGGKASQSAYAGFARDRAALGAYLASLSAVTRRGFDDWSKPQQLAFLINAYNAFTVELILRNYPGIGSIRDLGNIIFNSPWKRRFFTLLDEPQHLDGIEHDIIRKRGAYDDPRIHFAVNCASIGCPMLREEAYVADRLDAQLEEQTARFLSDRSRNRYDAARGVLEVSMIFDWYASDFSSGPKGIESVEQFLARYAGLLADGIGAQKLIRAGEAPIRFLEYDWALNEAQR